MPTSFQSTIPKNTGGFVTGGVVFALSYGPLARRRRLKRIEEKLDAVVDGVADDDGADP
jgi:hypothetical protein